VLNHRSNITAQGFATNSTENRILILVRLALLLLNRSFS
jgi:hypothetical protein